jgi:hypothetical protein
MNLLENSMTGLIASHDLLNVGITCHSASHFTVLLQWAYGDDRCCVIGHGKTSAEALTNAIADMQSQRLPVSTFEGELAA